MNPSSNSIGIDQSGKCQLVRDEWGKLTFVDANGNRFSNISPIPLFPISDPQRWISLVDAAGTEIACLSDLTGLADCAQSILKEELSFREFVPRILKVFDVSGTTEPCEWKVETDRGLTTFILKSEEDIRRLNDSVVQIVGSDGIRFRVDDMRHLDARSRRFIEWYV